MSNPFLELFARTAAAGIEGYAKRNAAPKKKKRGCTSCDLVHGTIARRERATAVVKGPPAK
jgi:hypothetical protein